MKVEGEVTSVRALGGGNHGVQGYQITTTVRGGATPLRDGDIVTMERVRYDAPKVSDLDQMLTIDLLDRLWASFYDNRDGRFGDPKNYYRELSARIKAAG